VASPSANRLPTLSGHAPYIGLVFLACGKCVATVDGCDTIASGTCFLGVRLGDDMSQEEVVVASLLSSDAIPSAAVRIPFIGTRAVPIRLCGLTLL
jgi:hypothetical protein